MQHFKETYIEDGYIHLTDFLQMDEVEFIRKEAKAIFLTQLIQLKFIDSTVNESEFEKALYKLFKNHIEVFINCGKQIQHLISLHQLSLDERLLTLLNGLGLKNPIISTRPVLFFNSRFLAKKEVYWKTPAHQDWRSIQGSINAMVIWIPLLDIDKDLGALEVIPKSHKNGLITNDVVDSFGVISEDYNVDASFVPLEVKAGDIVVFSQFLIHRSGNNTTNSIRWSCHFRYNDLEESSFIERGYPHTYIYKPDDTLIHPGFDTKLELTKYFKK